jgi:aspartate aminotransferase
MATPRKNGGQTLDVNLNLNVRGMPPSATVALNEQSNALRAQGKQVFKLGLGQSPFPVPDSVVEELKQNAHEKDYLPVKGLWDLRRAVAEYHRQADSLPGTAEDVLIGPGSKELMFILQLVYYGDLVIPTPSWVSYAPQADIIGRKVRWIPTSREDGWMLRPETLEQFCAEDPGRPRIVILNYPSNPTGGTYKTNELKAMAEVARANKVVLLSDEIYGELHYKDQHVSIARFYPEGTIVSSGLSKWCGAGGWRLGTFLFPRQLRWLLDAMATVASETYTSTSAPIQYAAVRAFQGGLGIERYLRDSRRILSALVRESCRRLRDAGIDVETPRGAFYLFPDFTPLADKVRERVGAEPTSMTMCEKLLEETGVAILPGTSFGRPGAELTARMALVDFDGSRALTAAGELAPGERVGVEFAEAQCGNVLRAVDRLCEWVR